MPMFLNKSDICIAHIIQAHKLHNLCASWKSITLRSCFHHVIKMSAVLLAPVVLWNGEYLQHHIAQKSLLFQRLHNASFLAAFHIWVIVRETHGKTENWKKYWHKCLRVPLHSRGQGSQAIPHSVASRYKSCKFGHFASVDSYTQHNPSSYSLLNVEFITRHPVAIYNGWLGRLRTQLCRSDTCWAW